MDGQGQARDRPHRNRTKQRKGTGQWNGRREAVISNWKREEKRHPTGQMDNGGGEGGRNAGSDECVLQRGLVRGICPFPWGMGDHGSAECGVLWVGGFEGGIVESGEKGGRQWVWLN